MLLPQIFAENSEHDRFSSFSSPVSAELFVLFFAGRAPYKVKS